MQDSEIALSTRKPAGPKTGAKGETDALEASIASAAKALCALQRADGHFVFELEADATIPAEYVLMCHYRGEPVDAEIEMKIARYLRRIQSADGGWPLFHGDASDVSASVKAYFEHAKSELRCWRGPFTSHLSRVKPHFVPRKAPLFP